MKISQLAKQLKMPSKQLLIQVVKLGIPAKSIQSSLSGASIDKLIATLSMKKPSLRIEDIKKPKAIKKKGAKIPKKRIAKPRKAVRPTKKAVKEAAVKERPPVRRVTKVKEIPPPKIEPTAAEKVAPPSEVKPSEEIAPAKTIEVRFPLTVKALAEKIAVGASLVIKALMGMRIFATINQLIDEKDAEAVAEKFGCKLQRLPTAEEELIAIHEKEEERQENLLPRPPVVTFMGHVDHGKTSLLDYIRKSKITDQEKGGITQHIGAYSVFLKRGKITFLDTPGHEAFTAMRARGAHATDIVVLVVAADDGVMPQTIEALDHARAAEAPVVVAINKADKPDVDIDRVKKQLADLDLTPEDWGGKTVTVNVSAKTGQGIDQLLELILLEAELLELRANPNKSAKGIVIEGRLSKGGGPTATVLVQNGVLHQGDIVVAGHHYGRIRAMIDDRIHRVKEVPPSMPVEILGLNGTPHAGDTFMVVEDDRKAKEITDIRKQRFKEEETGPTARRISLEDLYSEIQKGKIKELKVILKADVRGSLEAISDSLTKLSTGAISLNIIHKGIGDVSESDILLAAASNAIIIGFHVRKTAEADRRSKAEDIDIRLYSIMYEAVSDIKAAMEGLLEPHIKENFMGKVLVRKVFKVSKSGIIAGSIVQKGKVTRNADCRLIRNAQEVYKGRISSLKRFKDDVKEIAEGFECGIALENFQDIQPGDIIEAFSIQKVARKL